MSKTSEKTQDTAQAIDPALQRESHSLMNLFRLIAGAGYQPNRGVTIAGFTPQQEAAMTMANQGAAAFGFDVPSDPMSAMPETEMSGMGIAGYRPAAEYDASMAELPQWYKNIVNRFNRQIGKQSKFREFKPEAGGGGGKK